VRRLPISFPAAAFSARGLRGKPYKDREDRLDALLCAYLAALAAKGRLEMLGRPDAGSIVVPATGA
jgi:predicted RNase H-like nuclease